MKIVVCLVVSLLGFKQWTILSADNLVGDRLGNISNVSYFEPAVYDVKGVADQHHSACNRPYDGIVVIELYAFERYFTLILKQNTHLFAPEARVHTRSWNKRKNHSFDFREFYTGKVAGDGQSTVIGKISNGTFDGSFFTAGETFHLEPASRYFKSPVPFHSVIFPSSAVSFNASRITMQGEQVQRWKKNQAKGFLKQISSRRPRAVNLSDNSSELNTCALHIAADHLYLKHVGKGSVDDTVAEMIFHIAQADNIFRSTDFNGDGGPGDNIGFNIGAVTVYFDAYSEGILASPTSVTIMDLLTKWSKFDHNAYCLAVLFTYRDFPNGVLGLAWVGTSEVGGICSERVAIESSSVEMNFNTAVVSFLNNGVRVPRKATIATVAHELGHNFGSEHDPSTKQCMPGGNIGYFLMYSLATDGSKPNNYLFSRCSKAAMWPMIYEKGPQCFVAHNKGAFCGNKIVEEGEQCDCGLPHECSSVDSCCDPGNITSGIPTCAIKSGSQCSPKQGPCCKSNCTFIAEAVQTICQEETLCSLQSTCNGTDARCPKAIPKPTNTTCNGGTNTCLNGYCVGPICAKYDSEQCECNVHAEMCHVCCKTQGSFCLSARLLTGKDVILKPPGSTCNKFTGYCNQHGQCITVDTDTEMDRLKESFKRMMSSASINSAKEWLANNWYYVLLVILGTCLVASLLRFYAWRYNPIKAPGSRRAIRPNIAPFEIMGEENEAIALEDIHTEHETLRRGRVETM